MAITQIELLFYENKVFPCALLCFMMNMISYQYILNKHNELHS
jgi:hypothetical protein